MYEYREIVIKRNYNTLERTHPTYLLGSKKSTYLKFPNRKIYIKILNSFKHVNWWILRLINYTSWFNYGPGFFHLYWVKISYIWEYAQPRHNTENSKKIFPEKRNCAATVPISTFMCLWAIYMIPGSICLFLLQENMLIDHENIYVIRSQTHECGKWVRGRAIPRKGIHK